MHPGIRRAGELPQPRAGRLLLRKDGERIGGDPLARLLGIDVREASQDQIAEDRSCRKRVHMQQIVTFNQRQFPAPLFDRAEAGVVHLPRARVIRQNAGHERERATRVLAHSFADRGRLASVDQPGHLIDVRLVCDILVKAPRVLCGSHERGADAGRNLKAAVGKKKNVAALKRAAIIPRIIC